MQKNTVFIRKYSEDEVLSVNEKEIWRYAGCSLCKQVDENLSAELIKVRKALDGKLTYKACFIKMKREDELLSFLSSSKDLSRFTEKCEEIIIFCASIGLEIDRFIAKYQKLSPIKALIANAYGTERVEALCDILCKDLSSELKEEGFALTNRFSPGYGDLPLEVQKDVFSLLDCSRRIGVSLNESLLMSPSKSVTAVIGIKKDACSDNICKCNECNNKICQFRKQEAQ